KLVRVERTRVDCSRGDGIHRHADAFGVYRRIALVRVDHVEPSPVPQEQVRLAGTVLVKPGDDEPPAFRRELAGKVERPLRSDAFDDALAQAAASHFAHLVENAPVVVHRDHDLRAETPGEILRERTAGDGDDPRADARRESAEKRTEKADADDRDRLSFSDVATAEDVHGAAERFAGKRLRIDGARKGHD